ncbi:GT4 family glycosyltransferase PelF [Streptomyces sp. AK08-02]|uniref:GT4 family glycosyltransferase PelF n=1 Tax=Streptomyces sp. AK08-02 TaxID=3028654 RepID=UPI0039F47058
MPAFGDTLPSGMGRTIAAVNTGATRVTMLTEGTYPHSQGGVSVWCDQLVRGIPDVDFQILAVTADGREPVTWETPAHVSKVVSIPTWGPTPTGRVPRGRRLRSFLDTYEMFLLALLDPGPGPGAGPGAGFHAGPSTLERFAEGLYGLAARARYGELTASLRTEAALRTLAAVWNRPHLPTHAARPTMHDALAATDLLEHALRPLATAPPRDGITHAVSGGLAALPGLLAQHLHGTPLLLTEHGVYLRERYIGYGAGGSRWPVKALLLGFFRLLAQETYARAALVTPGNHYNRRWEERGGTAPDKIRTVYNGVDPGAFPPAGPEPEIPTLAWAGRVDPIKDLETLIRAFALVRREMPEVRLRLFGGTPSGGQAYRERCQALGRDLGIAEAVAFEGRVEDIRDAYAAGTVVMLSSISEGFPFTLIEAMSCGRATISTDVGGVREAVGDAGIVVPPREPEAMARAALELLRAPARRAWMGEAARLRVIDQFTLRHTIDSFREIYGALAAGEDRAYRAADPAPRARRAGGEW